MLALPQGAADTAPMACSPPVATSGWPGRNGARWAATAIGPMPGPAAAVGNAEGLVQVEVAHVGADRAGPASPTWAFMLAPSM